MQRSNCSSNEIRPDQSVPVVVVVVVGVLGRSDRTRTREKKQRRVGLLSRRRHATFTAGDALLRREAHFGEMVMVAAGPMEFSQRRRRRRGPCRHVCEGGPAAMLKAYQYGSEYRKLCASHSTLQLAIQAKVNLDVRHSIQTNMCRSLPV